MTFSESGRTGDSYAPGDRVTLRDAVRVATASDHAALDGSLAGLKFSCREDLVLFLGIHLAARAGLEAWLLDNCPPEWVPPPQTGLIADDLTALGGLVRSYPAESFEPDAGVAWLGPAYVVAGAHLGNRLLLAQAGPSLPEDARRFLTGTAMQDYWKRLRSLIDQAPGPEGAAAMIAGAKATFEHFGNCVARCAGAELAAT